MNTFSACPEQARTIRNKTAVDTQGSKMVRGTVVHAAIEAALSARMAGNELTGDDVLEIFHMEWEVAPTDHCAPQHLVQFSAF